MGNIHVDVYAKDIELTPELHDYVVNRVTNLGKYLSSTSESIHIYFEIQKTTNHHKGDAHMYEASCKFNLRGQQYYARHSDAEAYAAIDGVKENLYREIRDGKGKKESLVRKGHRILKGLFKRAD